ncbi:MAG: hypothetical protein ABFR32_05980 [Bacteroidota bacterium]
MHKKRSNTVFLIIMTISFSVVFFLSCKESSNEGMIVFTQVEGDIQKINYITGNSWRYIPNSRIVALNSNKSGEKIKVLTEDYFSACSPDISYDGKFMLFAAQKKQNDIWQIWEMNLENLKIRQITSSSEDCFNPSYLPGKRMVFSKFTTIDNVKEGYALFTSNLDGSEINQITFNPHAYFASTVLQDGRILTISRQLFPEQKDGMFMVMRPDGTKQELFYKGLKGSEIHSRGWETNDGKVFFIETDNKDKEGGDIISVNYNRPLHSRVNLSSGIEGDFYAVSPIQAGSLLVSYRSSDNDRYALYEFDEVNKTLGKVIYKDENYNILEAVVIKKKERPRKLPSDLNMSVNTGLLLCQDINFTDVQSVEDTSSISKAVRIEVMGIDTSLGIVDVEKDGSFYLKVLADTPFRIQTISEDGQVVNGPGSWIYLRPNERRGCVGCHEDHEQVPYNRQPLSVRKEPIILPKQLNKVHKEKDS